MNKLVKGSIYLTTKGIELEYVKENEESGISFFKELNESKNFFTSTTKDNESLAPFYTQYALKNFTLKTE